MIRNQFARPPPAAGALSREPTHLSIDVAFGSAAARVAVMTTDESVMLAAQESVASDFHITLLDAADGVLALQNEVPLEAVILDLDTPEGSAEAMVELVNQLRARDEDLVLIGLIQSLTKVWRRKLLAAGTPPCFPPPRGFPPAHGLPPTPPPP